MFRITDHIEFDAKGRAQCPSCLTEFGKTKKNLALVPDGNGAYKCHRGCTPEQIREALGQPKERITPPSVPPPKDVTVTPQRVADSSQRLRQGSEALEWLEARGITEEMARFYNLGVTRSKVGQRHLPAISIPIPANQEATRYFQKKRVAPWLSKEECPPEYKPWSQYGIPATIWETNRLSSPAQTWLCEGEWDAIKLGWMVKMSDQRSDIQVICFTCGAGNVPPDLTNIAGQDVIIFYDRDEAGKKGARKVAERLGDRCRIAQVPSLSFHTPGDGWDVSDAINGGCSLEEFIAAAKAAEPFTPKDTNPLRSRLITHTELLARAPEYTDWLVPDLLTSDELFLLAASPRAGKSLLAMSLAEAVANGKQFLQRPCTQGNVIYVRCEDSDTKLKERAIAQGWPEDSPVFWMDKFKLDELNYLEELIKELDARLIVFDTLSRIRNAAINENSAEMSQVLEPLQEMCKANGCTGLLVHHTKLVSAENAKDIDPFTTIRGSSAIRATCRGTLVLAADEQCYRLCYENGWGKGDLKVLLDPSTLKWKLLGQWTAPTVDMTQKEVVLEFLNRSGSATIEVLNRELQIPQKSLYQVLARLCKDDLVEKHGSRKNAVYARKGIQQIQQLNSVLNSPSAEPESDRGLIQQDSLSPSHLSKVIISPKSDQPACDSQVGSPHAKKCQSNTQQGVDPPQDPQIGSPHTKKCQSTTQQGVEAPQDPLNDHFSPHSSLKVSGNLLNNSQNSGTVSISEFNTNSTPIQQPPKSDHWGMESPGLSVGQKVQAKESASLLRGGQRLPRLIVTTLKNRHDFDVKDADAIPLVKLPAFFRDELLGLSSVDKLLGGDRALVVNQVTGRKAVFSISDLEVIEDAHDT